MAYTPTEWKNGDVITAEGLNHIEQGLVNCGGEHPIEIANLNAYRASANESYEVTSNKTFAELMEAYENGAVVVLRVREQTGSNPYHVYSEIADVQSTFNEHGESVIDRFIAVKAIDGYTGNRIEMGIASYGVYYSFFS